MRSEDCHRASHEGRDGAVFGHERREERTYLSCAVVGRCRVTRWAGSPGPEKGALLSATSEVLTEGNLAGMPPHDVSQTLGRRVEITTGGVKRGVP